MLKPTFQDYVEQNVHFRSTCNDTIFVKKKTRNKKTLMMSNKMLKTHLSRWCWTKCSFPINFVSNSCCLHSPLFSSAHSRSTWANKIKEVVLVWLKRKKRQKMVKITLLNCNGKGQLKTLLVNPGKQDKRNCLGLIKNWKLKITLLKIQPLLKWKSSKHLWSTWAH